MRTAKQVRKELWGIITSNIKYLTNPDNCKVVLDACSILVNSAETDKEMKKIKEIVDKIMDIHSKIDNIRSSKIYIIASKVYSKTKIEKEEVYGTKLVSSVGQKYEPEVEDFTKGIMEFIINKSKVANEDEEDYDDED